MLDLQSSSGSISSRDASSSSPLMKGGDGGQNKYRASPTSVVSTSDSSSLMTPPPLLTVAADDDYSDDERVNKIIGDELLLQCDQLEKEFEIEYVASKAALERRMETLAQDLRSIQTKNKRAAATLQSMQVEKVKLSWAVDSLTGENSSLDDSMKEMYDSMDDSMKEMRCSLD